MEKTRWVAQMLVIIEGVDGSGKTTLFNQLSATYDKVTQPANTFADLVTIFNSCPKSHVKVCDRSFLTDVVYRANDKKKPFSEISIGNALVWADEIAIVLCDNDSSFYDAMRRGEDNIVNKQHSDALRKTYRDACHILNLYEGIPICYYDWHVQTYQDVIDFIEKEVRK